MVHVLIVDDDEDTRATLRMVLAEGGYTAEECADGRECLQRLYASAQSFVVLLDYRIPGVSGEAVLEAVEEDTRLAMRHTFIAMTASPQMLTRGDTATLRRLYVPLVEKPFDIDALLAVVDKAAASLSGLLQ